MTTFSDRIAVVTGAASGIGRALAVRLAGQGARVMLADIQLEAAARVAEAIRASGGWAAAHYLDVTDNSAVEGLVRRVAAGEGRIDYMFNNAGIAVLGEFRHLPSADWKRIVEVNVGGVFAGTAAAYEVMIGQGEGHIVNTASVAGLVPAAGIAAYCASKHAVVGLSTSLRAEAAIHGVNVSVLCPGFIRTPMLDSKVVGEPAGEKSTARILRLAMTPEECAARALQGVARNQAVIPVTGHARLLWAMQRWLPGLLDASSRRMARRLHEERGRRKDG